MRRFRCPGFGQLFRARHRDRFCNLLQMRTGSKGIINALECGQSERSKLCALGLTPGTRVEVWQDCPGGCRLKVRDSTLVLDSDLAHGILCEAVE